MYCVNCGVKLADTEKRCPFCKTIVYHPNIVTKPGNSSYPPHIYPKEQPRSYVMQVIGSTLFFMAFLIVLLCDLQFNRSITWSGYVIGALIVSYVAILLPAWCKNPNTIFFTFIFYFTTILYLLYINKNTNGDWFFPFALPIVIYVGTLSISVLILFRFLKNRTLIIIGGAGIILGGFIPFIEYLLIRSFSSINWIGWSLYPMIVLVLLGILLIYFALNKRAREIFERKFFI